MKALRDWLLDVDPATREELDLVRSASSALVRRRARAEFWELLYLVRNARDAVEEEVRAGPSDAFRDALRGVRDSLGTAARDLRDLLPWASTEALEPAAAEAWVGFLLASPRGRELAGEWLNEVPEWVDLEEVGKKLGVLIRPAGGRRLALKAWQAGSNGNGHAHSNGDGELDAGLVRDVALVEEFRNLLLPERFPLEVWEVFCSLEEGRRWLESLLDAARKGEDEGGAARLFFGTLYRVRSAVGPLAAPLRAYLRRLPGGGLPDEVFELALAFVLASPRGRESAARWLAGEATRGWDRATRLAARCRAAVRARSVPRKIAAVGRSLAVET